MHLSPRSIIRYIEEALALSNFPYEFPASTQKFAPLETLFLLLFLLLLHFLCLHVPTSCARRVACFCFNILDRGIIVSVKRNRLIFRFFQTNVNDRLKWQEIGMHLKEDGQFFIRKRKNYDQITTASNDYYRTKFGRIDCLASHIRANNLNLNRIHTSRKYRAIWEHWRTRFVFFNYPIIDSIYIAVIVKRCEWQNKNSEYIFLTFEYRFSKCSTDVIRVHI